MALDYLKIKPEDAVYVRADDLRAQVASILTALGVPEEDATVTARILVMADLRGVDTHGAGNVIRYADMLKSGRYAGRPDVKVLSEAPSAALMTCGRGLGFVAAHRGMELAIDKARQTGMGSVTIRDGHHIGMVAYYAMRALDHDMIGMAMTNAGRSVRPALGSRPRLGTNPIAFAAPAGEERPFVLDMATSVVASGKLSLAARLGVPLPPGWIADAEGVPLKQAPAERSDAWSLLPLGGTREQGAHKGYGLAVMVDILAGVLSGGGYGSVIPGGDNMTFVMALDISKFRPVNDFKAMMDEMIRELHATPPEAGEERVLVAGDPEADIYEERSARGIPLQKKQAGGIRAKAREVGAPVFI